MIHLPPAAVHPDSKTDTYPQIQARINGQVCNVRTCRVSAVPFNSYWPGHQRPVGQSEAAPYLRFFADETVTVELTYACSVEKAVIRPLRKEIRPQIQGNTLRFTLEQPGDYVVEVGGIHGSLHLFFSPLKKAPAPEDVTYYFGPGLHYPVVLHLKSNDSVYVHPDATVFAAVTAENASNIRIFGGGVLNASCVERTFEGCYELLPVSNIRMKNCTNLRIEDVILLDSACWVLALFECDNIVIDGVKILGQWRYNTDGIDLTNTSNAVIRNCFIRSFDDTVVIKQLDGHDVTENITVEDCVCWCDWGKTLEIGLETAGDEIKQIRFSRCDLIRNTVGAMAISNGNYAEIHDIFYEDISVEYQQDCLPPQLETAEKTAYDYDVPVQMARLIRIHNKKFSDTYEVEIADQRDRKPGRVHDISYRNLQVFTEDGLPLPELHFRSEFDSEVYSDITIENVKVNGVPVTDLNTFPRMVKNSQLPQWK